MLQAIMIAFLTYRLRTMNRRVQQIHPIYKYEPFVFPTGCCPNISDSTTYETDDGTIEKELMKYDASRSEVRLEEIIRFGVFEL